MFEKYENLKENIKSMGNLAVAFSGGVDSSFLLKTAHEVLGDDVIAITAISALIPEREIYEAEAFCREYGIKQIIVRPNPLEIEGFSENPKDRCYICKKHLFAEIIRVANENDIYNIAEGSNIDDLGVFRPGLKAIDELSIKSPFCEAKLRKSDIRALSKEIGLSTWDKPSYACLASRFVYGEKINAEKLLMIDEAEQYLFDMGFVGLRVRLHKDVARIELNKADIDRFLDKDIRASVYDRFKELGFNYVTLDLKGYEMGSMDL